MEWMPQAIREGIFTILFISGPLVILAAGLGLSVGIVQAATQVQEQTLGSAVKILGLFLAIIIFGFYMFGYMRNYASENINRAFVLVPRLGSYIMPRKNFMEVPLDENMLNPPLEAPTELNEMPADNKSAPKLAEDLIVPDIEERADKNIEGTLGLPEMQRKKIGDANVKKQASDGSPIIEENKEGQAEPQNTPVQSNNTPNQQSIIRPAQPVTNTNSEQESTNIIFEEEKTENKRKPRRSLTDSLTRLRESIEEFNEYNKNLDEEGI